MKFAFSTVACPDWTLDRVVAFARQAGYAGVELRSFGHADPRLTCDPCHTDGAKARRLFDEAGVDPIGIATSIRYDAPVWPPFIGRVIGDFDLPVRQTKSAVEVARGMGADYARVFGFELRQGEERSRGSRRVLERARAAATTARHTGVRLALENAGSWSTGAQLAELIDACADPLVGGIYSVAAAGEADEAPEAGIAALGDRLLGVKLIDTRKGRPVPLGQGEQPIERTVRALARAGYEGWITVEWPRLWIKGLSEPEQTLTQAADRLYGWLADEQRRAGPARPALAHA